MHIDELRVSLWNCDLQNFGPKAKNRRLFLLVPVCLGVCQAVTTEGLQLLDCRPCYLDIFAAVATRIFETRCDGSSQVWSPLMVHEQLLEPLVRQSTCHGLLLHSCDHSLEGAAWSRPAYPQWTWYFFAGHPWCLFLGSHLWSLQDRSPLLLPK